LEPSWAKTKEPGLGTYQVKRDSLIISPILLPHPIPAIHNILIWNRFYDSNKNYLTVCARFAIGSLASRNSSVFEQLYFQSWITGGELVYSKPESE